MIYTYSKFYYGFTVTEDNKYMDFNEGSGELTLTLDRGNYTLTTAATAIESKLNDLGTLTYTVTVNRSTRAFTIAATGTFSLLAATGTNFAQSYYSEIGFTSDQTGFSSYTGTSSGSEYLPQFKLQSFVHADENTELFKATVNESTSGALEVISFGNRKYFELDIRYITNVQQPTGGPILSNSSGKEDAVEFLDFSIQKRPLELILDVDKPSEYYTVLLEKSPESGDGTRYKLKQNFGQLPDYYFTGVLVWRYIS